MSPGSSTESYPALAPIGLRENPGKNLNQVSKDEQRSYVKITVLRGRNARRCHSELRDALGDSALEHPSYCLISCVAWYLERHHVSAPYITACSVKDPDLNSCVLKQAKVALPELIKGDPKYKFPVLDPMIVEKLVIKGALNIEAEDLVVKGIRNTTLKSIE
ncbi:hypothetical protein ANN_10264 [Periplaneta americana]|uniref:Uncharacterized protein n=1 Tax=Periplaneta americana TaxID=6978 RepID=A0ABQ8TRA7_PERAM|nr:hypothetical protein ANN_10264 [Periplaneta americana]